MSGAIPPLLYYALMAWCLVKAQGQLYFTLLYFTLTATERDVPLMYNIHSCCQSLNRCLRWYSMKRYTADGTYSVAIQNMAVLPTSIHRGWGLERPILGVWSVLGGIWKQRQTQTTSLPRVLNLEWSGAHYQHKYLCSLRTKWHLSYGLRAGNFSLHHRVQNGSGVQPAFYPMVTKGSFPGGKAAGAWSWPLTSI
jgi:hypothetical protein